MTLGQFKELRTLQDHRVQMTFSDRQIMIATLLSVRWDFDESLHLVYDKVESSTLPLLAGKGGPWYAAGEELLTCIPLSKCEAGLLV